MAATINLFLNPDKGESSVRGWKQLGIARRIAGKILTTLNLAILIAISCCFASAQGQDPSSTSQTSINPKLPTVFVVGDSTANNHANDGLGWGDPFISF